MIAAGMPANGVQVFRRTWDAQAALRKRYLQGIGPIAAVPSWGAPHIQGVACDFYTSSGNRYAPRAAFLWAMSGMKGNPALAPRSTNDSGARARAYGWYRTVPSERWHLQYDPKKDTKAAADLAKRLKKLGYASTKAFQKSNGLKADGVAGPATWTKLLTNPKSNLPEPATVVKKSDNGWPVITTGLTALPAVTGSVKSGDVHATFSWLAEQYAKRVEPIVKADSWGYANRLVRGSETVWSNHASGTAVDFNASKHPLGAKGTMTPEQAAACKAIEAESGNVLRWGDSIPDEMHWELRRGTTAAQVAKFAQSLKPVVRDFRFAQVNWEADRFDADADTDGKNDDWTAEQANWAKEHLNASLMTFQELPEPGRKPFYAGYGGACKAYVLNYLGVMARSEQWTFQKRAVVMFDTKGVQGAVRATMLEPTTGHVVDVISVHVRPLVAAKTEAAKLGDVRDALKLVRKGVPTIFAGDFNTPAARKVVLGAGLGFVAITPDEDTMDKAGSQRLDMVFATPEWRTRKVTKIKNPHSDHSAWLWQGTLPKNLN